MPPKKRSQSKADRDPVIIEIKALRDSIANKEAAGEACKGLFKCYKDPKGNKECLATIRTKLEKLKAAEAGPTKASKSKGGRRSRSRSRSRSKSRK